MASPEPAKSIFGMIRAAASDLISDQALTYAAAIAFYTALSFAPLVLLFITIGGVLGDSTQNDLVAIVERQIGPQASQTVEQVVATAEDRQRADGAWWRWILSIGILVFSASTVFAQLQASLNHIWEVEGRPGQGVWGWIRKRVLSMGMIFAVLFILLVSLAVSTLIESFVPMESGGVLGRIISIAVSVVVITLLFALIFRYLPDVEIHWGDVWIGAAMTAVLFTIGKAAIGLYVQFGNVGESYGGAAASIIALLVWVYYSAIIFFFGAELTEQTALRSGRRLEPDAHARWQQPPTPKRFRQQAATGTDA